MVIECELILLVSEKILQYHIYTFTINSIDSRQADGFQFA